MPLDITFIVIFARAAREPFHNNSSGPLPKGLGTPVLNKHELFLLSDMTYVWVCIKNKTNIT
jgi:hypothetical protein